MQTPECMTERNPHIAGMYIIIAALIGLIGTFGAILLKHYLDEGKEQDIAENLFSGPEKENQAKGKEPTKTKEPSVNQHQPVNPITNKPSSEQNLHPSIRNEPQNYSETSEAKEKDYGLYINPPLNKSNISVAIVDKNGTLSLSLSSEIANIYKRTGNSVSTNLIRSTFTKKPEFQELFEGNSEIIKKLNTL